MTIKNGDLVVVTADSVGQNIATKCYSCRLQDKLVLKAKCSDNTFAGIYVVPMKFENDIGFRPSTSDSEKAAVTLARGSFIAMCWIDEASPIYTNESTTYLSDLDNFYNICKRSVKWNASCQAPSIGFSDKGISHCIYASSGYPQDFGVNIYMEDIHRSPDLLNIELTNMFDLLLSEFRSTPPYSIQNPEYIILTIDVSGSMNQDTIEPAYTNLVSHIQSKCPTSNLRYTTYSNEAWLGIWFDQIKDII